MPVKCTITHYKNTTQAFAGNFKVTAILSRLVIKLQQLSIVISLDFTLVRSVDQCQINKSIHKGGEYLIRANKFEKNRSLNT